MVHLYVKPVKTAEDEAYNKEMDKRENRVNEFTIIHYRNRAYS